MTTHCNPHRRGFPEVIEGLPNPPPFIAEVAIPNCTGFNVSIKEKAKKTYIRLMRDDSPVVRVIIDQETGQVEWTHHSSKN